MSHLPITAGIATTAARVTHKIQAEKAAEEARLRKGFQDQLIEMEAQARKDFEKDLAAKLASERSKFESEMARTKKMSRVELEAQLAKSEAAERAKFLQYLVSQKAALKKSYEAKLVKTRTAFGKQLEAQIRSAKKEYVRATGKQLLPSVIRSYRETQMEILSESLSAEAEVFYGEMEGWEKEARGQLEPFFKEIKKAEIGKQAEELATWEQQEKARLEQDLSSVKSEAILGFETEISAWKEKETTEKLEPAIAEWSKTWKPKGLAERLLDIQVTPLVQQVGYKPVITPEGLLTPPEGYKVRPFAGIAGLIAAPEAFIYSIGQLAGLQTPRVPPTLLSGFLGKGFETFTGVPSETLARTMRYGAEYAAGTLVGDLLLSLGFGKAAQKLVVEPVAKSRVGQAIGATIRAKAPKPILRVIYGKKGAEAIAIEKAWSWEPLPSKVVGVEKAALEAQYGMPIFRAETLHYGVPTTEFARLRFAEWLAPRAAIESQLSWELGLAPAYAAKGAEVVKPLNIADMMKEAERIPVYAPEKTLYLGLKEGAIQQEIMTKMFPTGKETIWTRRGAFEFEQATKMMMPSRLFTPKVSGVGEAASFYVGKGIPTTPFTKTLSKAISREIEKGLGGVTAIQLAPEILKTFPVAPPSPATIPKAPVRLGFRDVTASAIFEGLGVKPAVGFDLSKAIGLTTALLPKEAVKEAQIQVPSQIQVQPTAQAVAQVTRLRTKQAEVPSLLETIGVAPPSKRAVSIPAPPALPPDILQLHRRISRDEEKRKIFLRKRRKEPWARLGALFEYPVRREKEIPSFVLAGVRKQQKKRGKTLSLSNVILNKKRGR